MQEDDYEPRPNDFLVEPMLAPFEPRPKPWFRRLWDWLLRRS